MKLIVFGATGTVGRVLVEQALRDGHRVTAVSRKPATMGLRHPRLDVVAGDVLDPGSIEGSVAGQDAVLVALGAGSRGRVRATGTRNIVEAMRKAGVQRLVCLSSLGVGASRGNLNFFWKYIMFGLLLRKAFADHVAQERYVKESGLRWTIVRPGAFTDGTASGRYQHGFPATARDLELRISRADVAHFILGQLRSSQYVCATPGLSY